MRSASEEAEEAEKTQKRSCKPTHEQKKKRLSDASLLRDINFTHTNPAVRHFDPIVRFCILRPRWLCFCRPVESPALDKATSLASPPRVLDPPNRYPPPLSLKPPSIPFSRRHCPVSAQAPRCLPLRHQGLVLAAVILGALATAPKEQSQRQPPTNKRSNNSSKAQPF